MHNCVRRLFSLGASHSATSKRGSLECAVLCTTAVFPLSSPEGTPNRASAMDHTLPTATISALFTLQRLQLDSTNFSPNIHLHIVYSQLRVHTQVYICFYMFHLMLTLLWSMANSLAINSPFTPRRPRRTRFVSRVLRRYCGQLSS